MSTTISGGRSSNYADLQHPMSSDLLPELIAESATLPELLEKVLQHAYDNGIHADALGLGPLPQLDPASLPM